jgi:hypothetical protein
MCCIGVRNHLFFFAWLAAQSVFALITLLGLCGGKLVGLPVSHFCIFCTGFWLTQQYVALVLTGVLAGYLASLAMPQGASILHGVTLNERINDSLPDHWYVRSYSDLFHKNHSLGFMSRLVKFVMPARADDIGNLTPPPKHGDTLPTN